MKATILNKLALIEVEHDIKILFSCESGSRGWQFPSPDSDFDVRFIYVRPVNYYLSLSDRTDHLGFPINEELDIYGWDLRKVLFLTRKSNTTPFEWLQSPIVYKERDNFKEELWALSQDFFNCKTNAHHYLGIACGALESMLGGDEISIKKLFYVLRSLLSAKWCLDKGEIAPMTIGALMTLLPLPLQIAVRDLIRFKATAAEGIKVKIEGVLKAYIEEEFSRCSIAANRLEKKQFDATLLDEFFIKKINEYDN
ncbi:nucleotidyltransferase domain-containing protein [Pedobacter sp. HMWF019]|uniref:nucleotidyltransferase domain-containing protein n=1 Tax=Pedobacter sp. HMWF019 TaxID=2056856 RepID=UPI000D3CA4B7|nr:nucleotidyltransferase domain-containing protein [Pedobacter sp. HMWF019]PTT01662.1 nucleotidyltransferase domain-containing protein [Pedobacter sp. HMWF019]